MRGIVSTKSDWTRGHIEKSGSGSISACGTGSGQESFLAAVFSGCGAKTHLIFWPKKSVAVPCWGVFLCESCTEKVIGKQTLSALEKWREGKFEPGDFSPRWGQAGSGLPVFKQAGLSGCGGQSEGLLWPSKALGGGSAVYLCAACAEQITGKKVASKQEPKPEEVKDYCGNPDCDLCETKRAKRPPAKSEKCRTQKVRGLVALRAHHYGQVPSFDFFPVGDPPPLSKLVGKFCRPCPVRPRHGFVESRQVDNLEQAARLLRETFAADPGAEVISMETIAATHSAVWTPGIFSIGLGNSGATEGKDALTIPTLGNLVSEGCLKAAGIEQSPFIEIVYEKHWGARKARLVQLRDGPKLVDTADYIPKTLTIKQVLLAEGNLLEWEKRIKDAPKGAAVYHPGGTLASHYAIHAVAAEIPVFTSREPKVGETVKPSADAPQSDAAAIREGFVFGATAPMEPKQAVELMIVACHNSALWLGRADRLLGGGIGAAWRLTVTAALGEARHLKKQKGSRSSIYDVVWNKTLNKTMPARFRRALNAFANRSWPEGYGGETWFVACNHALNLWNALAANDPGAALSAFNALVNSAHNNGWLFDKFAEKSRFDLAVASPVMVLKDSAPMLYDLSRAPTPPAWKPKPLEPVQVPTKSKEPVPIVKTQAIVKNEGKTLHIQFKLKGMPPGAYLTKDSPMLALPASVSEVKGTLKTWSGETTLGYFPLVKSPSAGGFLIRLDNGSYCDTVVLPLTWEVRKQRNTEDDNDNG